MVSVRLLSLITFSILVGSQAHAMLVRTLRPALRSGQRSTRGKPCDELDDYPPPLNNGKQQPKKNSALWGRKLLATAAVVGGAKLLSDYYWQETEETESQNIETKNIDTVNIHVEEIDAENKKAKEIKAAKENFATFYLGEKKDLDGFIKHATELGMNPNEFRTKNGITALIFACNRNDTAMAEKLIEFGGFDINAQEGFNRNTALMYACYHGNLPMVKMLVKAGDDALTFDARQRDEFTALMLAVENKHHNIVHYLLEQPKVDPNIQAIHPDRWKATQNALSLAIISGDKGMVALLLTHENIYLEARCVVEALSSNSSNPEINKMVNDRREKQILYDLGRLTTEE